MIETWLRLKIGDTITAENADPYKHGRWLDVMDDFFECSVCEGAVTTKYEGRYNYCPYCGAMMDD